MSFLGSVTKSLMSATPLRRPGSRLKTKRTPLRGAPVNVPRRAGMSLLFSMSVLLAACGSRQSSEPPPGAKIPPPPPVCDRPAESGVHRRVGSKVDYRLAKGIANERDELALRLDGCRNSWPK